MKKHHADTIENIDYSGDEHEARIGEQSPPWLSSEWEMIDEEKPSQTWTEWASGWFYKNPKPTGEAVPKTSADIKRIRQQQQQILSDYQKEKMKLKQREDELKKKRTERATKRREEELKRASRLEEYKRKKASQVKGTSDRDPFESLYESKAEDDRELEDELEELRIAAEEEKRGIQMDIEQQKNEDEMMRELEAELAEEEKKRPTSRPMGMRELFATYGKKGGSRGKDKKSKRHRKTKKNHKRRK
jgi:hypothetical protein